MYKVAKLDKGKYFKYRKDKKKPGRIRITKGWTKKNSLKFYFVNFSAAYESRIKVLHIFQQPLLMQITKMTLAQFLDNFWAKIFNKPWGDLKIKVSIFMEVFEGSNHPFWLGPALSGWWKTFFGWWILFG